MTLGMCFDNFILSRRLADLSPKTIEDYREFIMPFLASVGSDTLFSNLRQEDINRYIENLLNRPLSKATRATYIRHLKIFLRWAEKEYENAFFTADSIKVPKTPKKSVRIYSDEELKAIFSNVGCSVPWISARNRAIIALMYDSGLRQSEVCFLKRSKLFLDDNRICVLGKGAKERFVPLGQLARHYLEVYLSSCPYQSEYVFVGRFGEALSRNAVKLMITKLSNKLDFELSSHKLRHNFATNYCLDQYDKFGQIDIYRLMYLLGHEDVETTKRYLHFAYEIIASRGCISHLDKVLL